MELIHGFVLCVCSENRLISLISRQHLHVVQLRAETRPNGLLSLPLRLQGGKMGKPGKTASWLRRAQEWQKYRCENSLPLQRTWIYELLRVGRWESQWVPDCQMDFVYSERVKQCVHRYTPEGREARGPVDKDRSNMGSLEGTCTRLYCVSSSYARQFDCLVGRPSQSWKEGHVPGNTVWYFCYKVILILLFMLKLHAECGTWSSFGDVSFLFLVLGQQGIRGIGM